MPWKPTKLTFCGVAVRRRTLYILTLVFAIAAVPALSWAILVHATNASRDEKYGFVAAAVVLIFFAFIGWWSIVRNNTVLFQHEARIIWSGAAVLLALATAVGCLVAQTSIEHSHLSYIAPLALGGAFMAFLLVRCFTLNRHPKRGDIVRGGPSRRSSRSPVPKGVAPAENAVALDDEDDLDGELIEDEAASSDSPQ